MPHKNSEYDIVRPEPENFLQSARSYGYSVETAIADLLDNSITAGASQIIITYGIDQYSSFVRIEDNGKGMSEKELRNAMKIGSFNPISPRNEHDLGRFGLGLKTASFSQCRRLTVKTRNKSENDNVRCWDMDTIISKEDWILLKKCPDKKSEKHLGDFIEKKSSGTIVLWEQLDRLMESRDIKAAKEHFYRKFDSVINHLGVIFHRFIEGGIVTISVMGHKIEAINPFHVSDRVPSTELSEEQLSIKGQPIRIQPYILPHESKLSQSEKKQLEIIKGWTEHQGIYLYRNKRLIADGTWLDLNFRKKESQRLCRICIDIPNTLDFEWQIDVKKASAKIPDSIRNRIRNISFNALDKAIKVYTHRGAYIKRNNAKKEIVYLWKSRQKHGKRFYEVNSDHPVYQLICEFLDKEAYVYKDYMKLLAESLPVSMIVNDFSDPSVTMKDFFENEKNQLKIIYENTLTALINAGVPKKDALEKINAIECFQQINNNHEKTL